MVLLHLMETHRIRLKVAFSHVRAHRMVAMPNEGFLFQLAMSEVRRWERSTRTDIFDYITPSWCRNRTPSRRTGLCAVEHSFFTYFTSKICCVCSPNLLLGGLA